MGQAKRKGKFGPEMQDALEENTEFVQSILAHSCSTAADVLCSASGIGTLANEFAHNIGDEDPLRQESSDMSKALAELISEQLQTKSPLAVANALFWAAVKVAASSVNDCPECEEEEFAKTTPIYAVN